ncbi:MAG: TIGR02099 family protein [Pseudomonadales bacterium]|nr:TIGR02099 family protein [Pseudomonadales bacterium]
MVRKTRRFLVNLAEVSILVCLVLAAAYVTMGRILLGSADQFRDEIEASLSAALNLPVHIGSIGGDWIYLDPRIEVGKFSIGNPDEPAVTLGLVTLKVDSVKSFQKRTLIVTELTVDGVELVLLQNDNGSWTVEGIPSSDKAVNLSPVLDSLPFLDVVTLQGVDIDVLSERASYKITTDADDPFALVNERGVRSMSWPLKVERLDGEYYQDKLQILGEYQGDPRDPASFLAELYLQIPSIEAADLLPWIETEDVVLYSLDFAGEFWLTFSSRGVEFYGSTSTRRVEAVVKGAETRLAENIESEFVCAGSSVSDLQFQFSRLGGQIAGQPWELGGTRLALRRNADGLHLGAFIPELSVTGATATLTSLADQTGLLGKNTGNVLQSLDPAGRLSDVHFSLSKATDEPAQIRLVAALDDVSVQPYLGSPGVSSVSGLLSAAPDYGYLDLHNQAPFSMYFAGMFDEPWPFDFASTRIHYRYQPGYLQLWSDLIKAGVGDLRAAGRFNINLPSERSNHTWGFEIGVQNADLTSAGKYLPLVMTGELRGWLGDAITRGYASDAGLLFHGSLFRDAPKIRKVHELFFRVSDTSLAYHPDWPPLTELVADIYINNTVINSTGARGRVFDSLIPSANVTVPVSAEGAADTILVDGRLEGPFTDGLRLLTDTPVRDLTRNIAADWTGSGLMTGDIELNIPVGARTGEAVNVDAVARFDGAAVTMPAYNLNFTGLQGQLRYQTSTGLNAQALGAELFGQPVNIDMATILNEALVPEEIQVRSRGGVSASDLQAWSGQVLLTQAHGLIDYDALLHVPLGEDGNPVFIEARSDLLGVHLDLPAPMGKDADSAKHLNYRQTFLPDGQEIDLQLGDHTRALLRTVGGELTGGRIHFGDSPLGAVAFDKVRVTGAIDQVNYSEWESLTSLLARRAELDLESELAGTLDGITVQISQLNAFGVSLEDVKTVIDRADNAWHIGLENQMLAGLIVMPDDDASALDVKLDYLRLPEGEEGGPDPLGETKPADIAALQFSVKQLMIGETDYGSWQFDYQSDPQGGLISNLLFSARGLEVTEPATVHWIVGPQQTITRFRGTVGVPDMASALQLWGYASSIEGKNFNFQTELNWPGSPAMIDLDALGGTIALQEGKGRFVQANASTGPLKLIGIFDFASLMRRFQFDFSDVVDSGFSFSKIKGKARFNKGVVDVVDTFVIEGAGSIVSAGGTVDLNTRILDNDLIVTLPVGRNLPWYAAYSALSNPLLGAGVLLAQRVFKNQINQMSSAKYKVSGTLDEPEIKFVSLFNDKVREAADETGSAESDAAEETATKPEPVP